MSTIGITENVRTSSAMTVLGIRGSESRDKCQFLPVSIATTSEMSKGEFRRVAKLLPFVLDPIRPFLLYISPREWQKTGFKKGMAVHFAQHATKTSPTLVDFLARQYKCTL
jgi:hypothetical protein